MLKRTALFAAHQRLGARLIDFGGWEMPVQYTSIIEEHRAVRTQVGLFDISHMGEFIFSGRGAGTFLNFILTNDVSKLVPGAAQYTLLCTPSGGTVDDLYLYRTGAETYLAIVNASRLEPDAAWIQSELRKFAGAAEVQFQDASTRYGAIAIQGPHAASLVDASFPEIAAAFPTVIKASDLKKNQIASVGLSVGSADYGALLARTGYTGEDGFEVVAPNEVIEDLWNKLLNIGGAYGIKPAGLGARDTLRTEACFPLYGHELDEQTSPLEAGLGFFIAFDKPDFIGRRALLEQKEKGPARRSIAFKMADKAAPPRPGYPVSSPAFPDQPPGIVTSGTLSPTLGIGIGLARVHPALAKPGTPLEVEVRGRRYPASVTSKPFYRKAV